MIMVPADVVSGESPLPGLQMAIFLLSPSLWQKAAMVSVPFLNKGSKPTVGASPSSPHLNLIASQSSHFLIPSR